MINLTIDTAIPKMIAAFNAGTLQFQTKQGLETDKGCYYRAPWDNNVTCIVGACISEDDWKTHLKDDEPDFSLNQRAIGELIDKKIIEVPMGERGFFTRMQRYHDQATSADTVEDARIDFVEQFNKTMEAYERPERLTA